MLTFIYFFPAPMIQGASTVSMETKFSDQKIFHRYVLMKSKKSATCMNLMIKLHSVIKTMIILKLKYFFSGHRIALSLF